MKIMYLLFSFTSGGTEHLVADICNEMHKRGNEVHLYIVNDLYSLYMLEELNTGIYVKLQKRAVSSGHVAGTVLKVTKYILDYKIDVVHCNALDTPELLVLRPLLFPRVRIIYTVHGVGQYGGLNKYRIWYRNLICDWIIGISNSVIQDMVMSNVCSRKIIEIKNAINFDKFNVCHNKKMDKENIILGNVARVVPKEKGQDILVRAVALLKIKHPNIVCCFAGDTNQIPSEEFDILLEMVHDLGIEDNVKFLGNMDDIPAFLQSIDIFILPSRSEGFGLSLIEAMAAGVPCIASNVYGPEEILKKGKYGLLFESDNEIDLADKVEWLLDHYTDVMKQSDRNKQYVQKVYGIEKMCNRLLRIYGKE